MRFAIRKKKKMGHSATSVLKSNRKDEIHREKVYKSRLVAVPIVIPDYSNTVHLIVNSGL